MLRFAIGSALILIIVTGTVSGQSDSGGKDRSSAALATPDKAATTHHIGALELAITNTGTLGHGFTTARWQLDCFTGERTTSCEYPRGSGASYMYGAALWIGGIVGRDTLVSTGSDGWGHGVKYSIDLDGWEQSGMEWHPDAKPFGGIEYRSIIDQFSPVYEGAVSEEDYICVYTDTFTTGVRGLTFDAFDGRPHRPLHLEVTQKSYAWSYDYADDFVLIEYSIKNIGTQRVDGINIGLLVDGDVYGEGYRGRGPTDDITGFLREATIPAGRCEFVDTLNLAWIADNEGDYTKATQATGVIGTRFLMSPGKRYEFPTYNWWTSNSKPRLDFGPRHKDLPGKPLRDFKTGGLGTPEGDKNKYHLLSNGEIDYDQIFTQTISPVDPLWLYPDQNLAKYISTGYEVRYLHSIGGFAANPGEVFEVTLAFVAGSDFHYDPMNMRNHLQYGSYYPEKFRDHLGFDNFIKNARWASFVFDNPGIDTDGNGYAGELWECCQDSVIAAIDSTGDEIDTIWESRVCDTVWYAGDGIPDFRGASPPPAPQMWVVPSVGQIRVRWNGYASETTPDIFSRKADFDGYRVYLSRDKRPESAVLLASFDLENYLKYTYIERKNQWLILNDPYSREELVCTYGDSCTDPYFDPRDYTRNSPLVVGDSAFFFVPQDYNRFEFGLTTPIAKTYPNAPRPIYREPANVPDSLRDLYLTEDGYFKYYEYEYIIRDLLPSVPYYVNVTAFDYGSPMSGLGSLETSRTLNAIEVYPLADANQVEAENLEVYVYPNPYRSDAGYIENGYEGRDAKYYIPDRMRRIHFANLPAKCTIGIYSLDGDLIRQWDHDIDPDDPAASHDTWDLITRNTQAVVSGLYYWTVEDEHGNTQIGKLVIIK